jgi:hypothetical protein
MEEIKKKIKKVKKEELKKIKGGMREAISVHVGQAGNQIGAK